MPGKEHYCHKTESNCKIHLDRSWKRLNKDADAASEWKALLFDEQARGVIMVECLTTIFTASFTVSLGLNLVNNNLQVRI